jgi:hypothetical protein
LKMKLYDIDDKLVNVDVRPDKYPVKFKSRSSLQGITGEKLQERYPRDPILEDFTIPGSRLSVDFFLPHRRLVLEVQGEAHDRHVPFFHKDRVLCNFAKQVSHDRKKAEWCETNGFTLIEIRTKQDLEQLDG